MLPPALLRAQEQAASRALLRAARAARATLAAAATPAALNAAIEKNAAALATDKQSQNELAALIIQANLTGRKNTTRR